MNYQVMPDLTPEEYAELKADIAERGVMVPVEFDEFGNVLDGHHRLRACKELGITDYPKVVRAGLSEEGKRTHARKLNMLRRQLTREQRQELIRQQLRETPERSDNSIAKDLGVDHKTVSSQREELEATWEIPKLDRTIGADGKVRPRQVASSVTAGAVPPSPSGEGLDDAEPAVPAEGRGEFPHVAKITDTLGRMQPKRAEQTVSLLYPAPPIDHEPESAAEKSKKPVSVFNPRPYETEQLKKPEVVRRMAETGENAVDASLSLIEAQNAERAEAQKRQEEEYRASLPGNVSLFYDAQKKQREKDAAEEARLSKIRDKFINAIYEPLAISTDDIVQAILHNAEPDILDMDRDTLARSIQKLKDIQSKLVVEVYKREKKTSRR